MASSTSAASDGSAAHPLRPYYQPPEDSVFIATAPRFTTSGNPQSASRSGPSTASASKPAANRYVSHDAAPYVATTSSGTLGEATASASDIVRALVISGALQFTSTCMAMPFEVGKLLLQVQWLPRDEVWLRITQEAALKASSRPSRRSEIGITHDEDTQALEYEADEWADGSDELDEGIEDSYDNAELSDEADADAYFRDAASQPTRPQRSLQSGRSRKRRIVDPSGYVMRSSVHDNGARPEFVMPVVIRGGVWEMMKAVARGKEGWLGLWKGALTSFILETTSTTIMPLVSTLLSVFAPSALTPLPLTYAPYPFKTLGLLLSSHLVTGILVSPLDLVRTRLIAQSTLVAHRKYKGPFDALKKVLREEGGWRTAYLHPNLLIPTVLDFTLRPLLSLGAPLLIEHSLRLEPNTHPISYAIAELTVSTISLCITLPIETVRRRLQLQSRAIAATNDKTVARSQVTSSTLKTASTMKDGSKTYANVGTKGLRACVETRPIAYVGVVEAIYRIVTEESSIAPPVHGRQATTGSETSDSMAQSGILARTSHSSFGGLRSLYRGFGMAFGANLVVFMLTLVSGERAGPAGWAEI